MIRLHKLPASMTLGISLASVMPLPTVTRQVAALLRTHDIGTLLSESTFNLAAHAGIRDSVLGALRGPIIPPAPKV